MYHMSYDSAFPSEKVCRCFFTSKTATFDEKLVNAPFFQCVTTFSLTTMLMVLDQARTYSTNANEFLSIIHFMF